MSTDVVIIEETIKAPIARVWQAITDKEQMKQWYFDMDGFKPEVGFEFSFIGKGNECDQYTHHCKITEVLTNKKLQYSWKYEGYEGNSLVTFELFEEGDMTRVKLTHEGLGTFPQSNPDFAVSGFTEGWNYFIGQQLPGYLK